MTEEKSGTRKQYEVSGGVKIEKHFVNGILYKEIYVGYGERTFYPNGRVKEEKFGPEDVVVEVDQIKQVPDVLSQFMRKDKNGNSVITDVINNCKRGISNSVRKYSETGQLLSRETSLCVDGLGSILEPEYDIIHHYQRFDENESVILEYTDTTSYAYPEPEPERTIRIMTGNRQMIPTELQKYVVDNKHVIGSASINLSYPSHAEK